MQEHDEQDPSTDHQAMVLTRLNEEAEDFVALMQARLEEMDLEWSVASYVGGTSSTILDDFKGGIHHFFCLNLMNTFYFSNF